MCLYFGRARKARLTRSYYTTFTSDPPRSYRNYVNLERYCGIMSFFCILMFQSLPFRANFLWSLLFYNSSVSVFHIANGVSLAWIFEMTWSLTPSKIILLTFARSFFHWVNYCESNYGGFSISILTYYNTPLSSGIGSI